MRPRGRPVDPRHGKGRRRQTDVFADRFDSGAPSSVIARTMEGCGVGQGSPIRGGNASAGGEPRRTATASPGPVKPQPAKRGPGPHESARGAGCATPRMAPGGPATKGAIAERRPAACLEQVRPKWGIAKERRRIWRVAQPVERRPVKAVVAGSSPAAPARSRPEIWPSETPRRGLKPTLPVGGRAPYGVSLRGEVKPTGLILQRPMLPAGPTHWVL